MSEEQEKYDLGIATIEGFNSLGEAVRYFRQKNDNLTISSICKFMGWQHSYLMDVEFGREILTDINTIKKLAEALEIHSSILNVLIDISQKPFIPEAFGDSTGSINGTIYRHNTFRKLIFGKNTQGLWVIHRDIATNKIPEIVFRGVIESNADAEIIFKSVGKVKE